MIPTHMENTYDSISVANPHPEGGTALQKIGLAGVAVSLLIFTVSLFNLTAGNQGVYLTAAMLLLFIGGGLYGIEKYRHIPAGIKNNGVFHSSMTNRGIIGWIVGILLTTFYIALYWFPEWIGQGAGVDGANAGMVALFDPLAQALKGQNASQWFVYGTFYTLAIIVLGIKFLYKYRHNAYHRNRTIVVIISQLFLAYLIPEMLEGLNYGSENYYSKDIKNMWPLNYYFTDGWYLNNLKAEVEQPLGMAYLVWGIILFLVVTPVVTYFVGKRWYCSWVCGCGGLAETAGDPYRHLSDKSTDAWLIERILIHGVMAFVLIMTTLLMITYFFPEIDFNRGINRFALLAFVAAVVATVILVQRRKHPHIPMKKLYIIGASIVVGFGAYLLIPQFAQGQGGTIYFSSHEFRSWYGFFIGSAFSGVIGVGFYPVLGNRVWCRFGCPLAGYMGLIQRFKSRFRITTNGGQCISCGNCSTYCEQGIDVRAYAQKGENIVRASCVGCGVCAAVCPRGVLKLENGPEEGRIHGPIEISSKGISVLDEK